MIKMIKYCEIKKIVLKNYINSNVFIFINGIINTRVIISKARVFINKDKIVFGNDENDITVDLFNVRNIRIENGIRLTLTYNNDPKIIMEV